ncbi:MAG TPA: hypothetical protein DEQ61_16930 [Streptomyces sp.]|nr:hypothetical protein [Streptomyces sp.]
MRLNPRAGAAAAALSGVLLLTGCEGSGSSGSGSGDGKDAQKPPSTATGTLEQLAEKAGCEPDMQTDAAELRQGVCGTKGGAAEKGAKGGEGSGAKGGDGRYVLTTFATNRGQQDWLSEAQAYGGSYLVGPKWVAVGDPGVLGTLRGRLGGEIETAPAHSGGAGTHSGPPGTPGRGGHDGHGDRNGHDSQGGQGGQGGQAGQGGHEGHHGS